MALPLRPRLIPHCPACLRGYAFGGALDAPSSSLRQQIRGRKKMPNNSGSITVRLLKDVEAYGRKGSLVPISRGAMRNIWFPTRIAEYVTVPEMKRLRLTNTPMERDAEFVIPKPNKKKIPRPTQRLVDLRITRDIGEELFGNKTSPRPESFVPTKAPEIELLSPHRSMELIDAIVPPRLDFYRQPIIEPKAPEKPGPAAPQFGGAAGDLLAARMRRNENLAPQAIYGSVSVQDVLVAMRAVMAGDEEAARVVLQESEIAFVDLPELEGAESGRVKHVGDFSVEVKLKGVEEVVRRVVRVIPQDAGSGSAEGSQS